MNIEQFKKNPVFLIHGMWSDARIMSNIEDKLTARGFTSVINCTLPFHHDRNSDLPKLKRAGIRYYTDKIKRKISEYPEKEVSIIGHSMGGLIALLCSGHEKVTHVAAINPAPAKGCFVCNAHVLYSILHNPYYLWCITTGQPIHILPKDIKELCMNKCTQSVDDIRGKFYALPESTKAIKDALFCRMHIPRKVNSRRIVFSSLADRITPHKGHVKLQNSLGIETVHAREEDHTSLLLRPSIGAILEANLFC